MTLIAEAKCLQELELSFGILNIKVQQYIVREDRRQMEKYAGGRDPKAEMIWSELQNMSIHCGLQHGRGQKDRESCIPHKDCLFHLF